MSPSDFSSLRKLCSPRLLPADADERPNPPPTHSPRRWILEARSQGRFDAGTICHACGDHYSHPALSLTVLSDEAVREAKISTASGGEGVDHREPLAIIGGTGYVGRSLAIHLLGHPTFRLGAIVGSSATVGKPFSAVFEKKEEALAEHYGADLWKPMDFPTELMSARVCSVEDVIERGECRTALSFIAPEHGEIEDRLAAAGVKVFSISPHARFDPANPLSVPEANPEVLKDAVDEAASAGFEGDCHSLVKSPNCVTCGVVVALKALDAAFGVEDVSVTTFQSLSGRGDAKYPRDVVMGNVYPLHGTVERTGEYQHGELKRIMPDVKRVSVAAYRVPVQRGHLVDVRVRFRCAEKPTARDVERALSSFDPLRDVPLPSKPRRVIYVKPLDEEETGPRIGTPRPKDDHEYEGGMSVCVGNVVCEDELYDVRFCLVVNNVVRGAWGAALLNAEYWHWLKGRKTAAPGEEPAAPSAAARIEC